MYFHVKSKLMHITYNFNFCSTTLLLMMFLLILLIQMVYAVPHIFDENYNFCENDFGIPDGKKLVFPNKLWTLATSNFVLYFSFCKTLQSQCRNRTSSCLIRKSNNQIIDLGHEFQMVDADNSVLESIKGDPCPHGNGEYTLTVNLECSDTVKPIPRLAVPDESSCNFEITMMRPGCQPKCTNVIQDAYMIDLRRFPKNIDVDSDSQKFSFSVCGLSRKCKSRDIGACEIFNATAVVPLAITESQLINYDISENELTARGRYKFGRVVRELNILIKCDWETEISKATFKKAPHQGKKYKFELESSYGCVKLPQNCFVIDTDNSQYNLSNIYNPNGWQVSNVSQGDIILNICGSLKNPPNTICSRQYSQVCHRQANRYINRGSILQPLQIIDDVIVATFVSGSRCKENVNLLYNTVIHFHCSNTEKGPIFKELKECTMFIEWETPHACPIYFYRGQDCLINDKFGYRNLKNLAKETDNSYLLSPSKGTELIYNLCGPLHRNCNNFNNVSFCLKTKQNKEVIIGWDNRELISENGILRLELTGNKCLNSENHGKVTINFICNYKLPSPPPEIRVIQDGCIFNMKVFTPLACISDNKFTDCTYHKGNTCYDLSTLSHKDRNYIVRANNVEYILNVCGPIVTGPGALCRRNTMVCLKNNTEVNTKHKYIPLGDVGKPIWRENNLIIEASMGTYCEGDGYYKSIIHFECSQKKFPPTLLSTSPCAYNFIWKTPEACPITKNCVISDLKTENSLNLTNLEEKILKVNLPNNATQYEFNLCNDVYKEYINGTPTVFDLRRIFYYENYKNYLTLELQTDSGCKNNSKIDKVEIEFRCNKNLQNNSEEIFFENCTFKMIVPTKLVCSDEKDHFVYSMESQNHTTSSLDLELMHNTEHLKKNKCLIINQDTGKELQLTQLKSKEIANGMNKYFLNFDGTLICSGILCKNGTQLLPMETCPVSSFDNENNYVKLQYLTELSCGHNEFFRLEVLLKCLKTDLQIIKNTTCELSVEYYSSEVCSLFHEKAAHSKSAIIGGVFGGILIVALICFIVYLIRNRRFPYIHISCRSDKTSVPIYLRNCHE